ncbi:MAG: patatin-like phospholipase family protein, partial [Natronospirillum sp.]
GVTDLPGSSPGLYRDGGMVDYHFDLPFDTEGGYVLYPHFSPVVKPGWFDKSLRWRRVKARHYQDVVMLRPTAAFLAKLPYGKIPDRSDFQKMTDADRRGYWKRTVQAGERLADELHDWYASGGSGANVKPFNPKG